MKPKTSTSQKPSAAQRESDRWLDWEDAVLHHCRNLTTLAELLADRERDGLMRTELVSDTGALIVEEARCLKQRLYARPGRGAK